MKKISLLIALLTAGAVSFAQSSSPLNSADFQFRTVKANPITSIKNQSKSGTCWAYSTISFLESEAIRLNGITDSLKYPDFSVFFTVSHSYMDRAVKYVRVDGALGFSAGSGCSDVLDVVRDYGLVPLSEMSGMNYGTLLPAQGELDAVLKGYIDAVVSNPNRKLTTAWRPGFQAILDTYLGEYPESFSVDGKQYTPQSYRDAMKIKPDDYISLTSFTHHPFYTSFALEVRDNWRWNLKYNVPIDEFIAIIDNAINNGGTLAWGTDVSHPGFTRTGYAILLDSGASESKAVSDQERWVGKDESESKKRVSSIVEAQTTQESRQLEFDNKTITDDHGMQIYGIAKDKDGKKYYMVKNSWGITGQFNGIWYASENFVRNQSMDITVHKSFIPKEIQKKLGIK